MMRKMPMGMVLVTALSLSFSGCSKDDDNPNPQAVSPVDGKTLLFTGSSEEAQVDVKVYTDEPLIAGYNKIYALIYEMGTTKQIKDAHVEFSPLMEMMGGVTHSAPVENPQSATPADGLFEGAIVFVMPSEGNGSWSLEIHVHNHANNKDGHVEGMVTVENPVYARIYSFISPEDSALLFVSLIKPVKAIVGNNEFEIVVHRRESMESWPFVADLQIEIEPEMPAMGHGSSGNVNPVYMNIGHYGTGVINLTMGGMWRVNTTLRNSSGQILDDTHYFEFTI